MYELILTMKRTPHGMRIGGPDPDRAVYLPLHNGHTRTSQPCFGGEQVWQSPEVDIVVFPAADGVEVKIRIHTTKTERASAATRAA